MNEMNTPPDASPPSAGSICFPTGPSFASPRETRQAMLQAEVWPALEWARDQVAAGRCVAGYIAYEAAPAFEPAFLAHPPIAGLPLLWLAAYDAPQALECSPSTMALPPLSWQPGISVETYYAAFAEIRCRIAAGETYQVNYTFPLTSHGAVDGWNLFQSLYQAQPVPHAAYLDLGRWQIASLSPELFFHRTPDGRLFTRPMKGTCPRGLYAEADHRARATLAASEKDRAENVMITDMLRNDMARVSATGSVAVDSLFEVERYATVWQMTSSIASRTTAEVPEILRALFPCGSVTGAPKIQSSKIIHALEPRPRGVYCGAIGYWLTSGEAKFNVAIRTLLIDRDAQTLRYDVGSGITWDAAAAPEYQECLDKARVVLSPRPDFALLETFRYAEGVFWLLEEHLARLQDSAAYFDYPFSRGAVMDAMHAGIQGKAAILRVRLTLDRTGHCHVETAALPAPQSWRIALASTPVARDDVFLYHKTTHRAVYDAARAARPDVDDVLLFNEDGELTESTMANLCIVRNGEALTPPRSSGLLAGTLRAHMLAEGRLKEAVLRADDLKTAERVFLINAVRGEIPAELVP